MKITSSILYSLVVLIGTGCATNFNRYDPYPSIETIQYKSGAVYECGNIISNNLIICMEGSGWYSALGQKQANGKWLSTRIGCQLLQTLGDDFAVVIPEKWDWKIGVNYLRNEKERKRYTADNLIKCYTSKIDEYVSQHPRYTSVILVGQSESAILLPIIYEKLAQKNRITALIAIAGGGLSLYQDYKIFSDEKSFPQKYKVQLKKLLYFYDTKSPQMNSTETAYLSMPYPYFAGFFSLQPADYYKSITIPVLFVHGEKDKNVPVESTRYMQKYFPDNHFDYLYYPKMAHGPSGHIAIVQFRNDISAWIMKHTK